MTVHKTCTLTIRQRNYTGTLSVELIVAVAIMVTLFGLLATLGNALKKADDYHWTQYKLAHAGQAQMDAIAVTGKPIDEAVFVRLWPGVTCVIDIHDGQEQWSGLRKVTLHLSAKSRNIPVETELTRYIDDEKELRP